MWARKSYKKRSYSSEPRELSESIPDAVNFMVGLLSKREFSAKELREKTLKRYTEIATDEALLICQQRGYQSEQRYAEMLVRHMEFALYGPMKLQFEARRKGVDLELVREASAEVNWEELAYDALVKKYGEQELEYEQRQKALAFLARRGFAAGTCIKAMEELKRRLDEAEE